MGYEDGRMDFGVVWKFQTWLTEGSEGAPSPVSGEKPHQGWEVAQVWTV